MHGMGGLCVYRKLTNYMQISNRSTVMGMFGKLKLWVYLATYVSILAKQHPNWTFVYKKKKKRKEGYGVGGYGK